MKIIDAVWEKRNLGTDVTEIQCDAEDDIDKLKSVLQDVNVPYSVCKIPSTCVELLRCAQEQGYQVVEMSIGMEGKTKDIELPTIYQRFIRDVELREADEREIEHVLNKIEDGTIFQTDRIALDPHYGNKIAGQRYCNWVKDLLPKGARICLATLKGKPVAFGINIDKDNGVSDAFLGGILDEKEGRGFGFLALYANLTAAKQHDNKKIVTNVSSNNPAIINLHLQYGFKISGMNYVLVKHQ